MSNRIKGYLSDLPARYFEEISAIPRASGNERAIADYLQDFAAREGLFCLRDKADNIFIRKAATEGREGEEPLLLQAHTDMVAEQNSGTNHDFEKEGIVFCQQGNILSADGTTLGADDGFGVALMLSVLADKALSHPTLECLFTTSEEIGLCGASAFDYSVVTARRMLNLDSAEEREVITGCCGGVRTEITLPATPVAAAGIGARVFLSGLSGGHSGEDINKGRGNAHILMGKLLKALGELTPFRLCSLSGGDKDNAIPRECEAIVLAESREALSAFAAQANALLAGFLTVTEDDKASVIVTEVSVSAAYSQADSEKMLSVLGIDNGVLAYYEGEQMPRTSRNLAKISSEEDGVVFGFSSRSANESELDGSCESLDALAASIGGTTRHFSRYPGWESAGETALCRDWQAAYAKVSGNSARATVIHAGLECGLITASLKGMQAISVGCNIFDLHTPQERVELDSFDRIYQTLLAFLAGK